MDKKNYPVKRKQQSGQPLLEQCIFCLKKCQTNFQEKSYIPHCMFYVNFKSSAVYYLDSEMYILHLKVFYWKKMVIRLLLEFLLQRSKIYITLNNKSNITRSLSCNLNRNKLKNCDAKLFLKNALIIWQKYICARFSINLFKLKFLC